MNPLLDILRFKFNPDWTISKVLLNNMLDGYAVEDEIREVKVKGETAVDYGTYPLAVRHSPKFSSSFYWSDSLKKLIEPKEKVNYPNTADWRFHELIWIKDTPRHEYCLIHWGNTDDHTDGCLIVGSSIGMIGSQEGVLNSREYYKKLYAKIYPLVKAGGQFIRYRKEEQFT